MKAALALAALVSLGTGGCQSPEHRTARLQSGMSRSQVLALLGPPKTVTHNGALEVMHFDLTEHRPGDRLSVANLYYVIFGLDRRVESFGPN